MLMQTFLSAEELGIPEVEKDALIKVLGMLERGEIDAQHFNMSKFIDIDTCGTVGCLCGWAHIVSNQKAFPEIERYTSQSLSAMFARLPYELKKVFWINRPLMFLVTKSSPEKAAEVLRTYLSTGKDTWAMTRKT